jgi:hypothetical protein
MTLPDIVVFPSGAAGSDGDSLPLSAVWRIMARVLPARSSIDLEAVHIVAACAGEMVALLTAAARERHASSDGEGVIGTSECLAALRDVG